MSKAIELLERIIAGSEKGVYENSGDWLDMIEYELKPTLAELKKQSEPTDFTKIVRAAYPDNRLDAIAYFREALNIIDTRQAENGELRKALKKYGRHSKECIDEKYPESWHCTCGFDKAVKEGK